MVIATKSSRLATSTLSAPFLASRSPSHSLPTVLGHGHLDMNALTPMLRSKVKIFGKLNINGFFEVEDALEVWGAVVIQGYM